MLRHRGQYFFPVSLAESRVQGHRHSLGSTTTRHSVTPKEQGLCDEQADAEVLVDGVAVTLEAAEEAEGEEADEQADQGQEDANPEMSFDSRNTVKEGRQLRSGVVAHCRESCDKFTSAMPLRNEQGPSYTLDSLQFSYGCSTSSIIAEGAVCRQNRDILRAAECGGDNGVKREKFRLPTMTKQPPAKLRIERIAMKGFY
ncbi:hypothetical protein EYF80_004505 [Liparis tanakae]|uniref:Uncharacterized protein n=1 Tax=Liparis tanakae TaxID=230148 RepID=A0A4Z2J478_9TELE|nr:hypothetical protein EYF80_004505 [Liparis tanakae]